MQNRPVGVTIHGEIDGLPLTIAFQGSAFGLKCIVPYLREIAAAREVEQTDIVDVWERPVSALMAELAFADIAVVEGPTASVWTLPSAASVVMPLHVHMVTELPSSVDGLDELIPRKERARVRQQIRNHGYTYRVTSDDSEFLWFYEHMHAPTMRARHADNARNVSASDALERVFHQGNLLLVCADGRPVGGTANFLDVDRGQVYGRLVGVLDGDPIHFRNGVIKATGRFLLEWACEAGYRSVDFQGCEPFLRNGTFQAKVLFGATVTHAPGLSRPPPLARRPQRHPAARAFLTANPILTCDPDDNFAATHFTNKTPPIPVHPHRGVTSTRTIPWSPFSRPTSNSLEVGGNGGRGLACH